MTCETCRGEGAIWLGAMEIDACPRCAAMAEAEWLASRNKELKKPRRANLRVVEEKAA